MIPPTLFCPSCDTLLIPLENPRLLPACPACGWAAPSGAEPGQPLRPPLELPLSLLPGLSACLAPAGLWLAGMHGESGALCHLPWGAAARPSAPRPAPEGWLPRGLALAGETLLFSPDEKEISGPPKALLGLDAHSREERWRYPVPGFMLTPPAGDTGLACAVDNRGLLIALDPHDGRECWPPVQLGDFPAGGIGPVLSRSAVLAVGPASAGGRLHAYDRQAGSPLWGFACPLGERMAYAPASLDDGVYAIAGGRLYAIGLAGGRELWHYAAPRQSSRGGFFAPPVAAAELILLLGGDYHPQRGPAYALQALDPESGQLRWRYFLEHTVNLPPVISGELVLLLDRHGRLTALDAASGDPRWKTELGAKPAAPMLAFGGSLYILTRDARLHTLALHPPQTEPDQPPDFYAGRGQWLWAAAAHLLRGQPLPAVEALLRAGDAPHALALSRLAGHPAGEIQALLALGREAEARALVPQLQDPAARGDLFARLGEHAAAAQDYQAAGQWEQAIRELEILGDGPSLERAAELAAQELKEPSRSQRLYLRAGEAYLSSGQPELAWERFFRATDFGKARQAHDEAVQLAGSQNRDRPQAELLLAWVRAEENRLGQRGVLGDTLLAKMLDEAAEAFARAGDPQGCAGCRESAAALLEMPRFHLQISAPEGTQLIEGRSAILHMQLENVGYGPARQVRMVVGGDIESPYEHTFHDLHIHHPQECSTLRVVPAAFGDVLLVIEMEYQSYRSGQTGRAKIRETIPVLDGGWLQKLVKKQAPVEIKIEKYVAPGASSTEMTISDSVFVRSPIGTGSDLTGVAARDSVFVRSPLGASPPEDGAGILLAGEPDGPACSHCGHVSEAGLLRCQGCGEELDAGVQKTGSTGFCGSAQNR